MTAGRIFKTRGVAMGVGAAIFLGIFFGLAGPSANLALYRLIQDGGCAILWLVAAGGIGWIFWRFVRPVETCGAALAGSTCVALGLGAMSLGILGLGLLGGLNHYCAMGIVGVGALIGFSVLFNRGKNWDAKRWLCDSAGWAWMWVAATGVAGVVILGAFFPPGVLWGDEPNGYDVVEYHLQVPREWFEAGRINPLHYNVFSYFPFNVEMHYLLAMFLHGGSFGPWAGMYLATLMHAGMCGVAAWAVFGLAGGGKRGTVAALLVVATPWTGLLGAVAYDDGGTLLFGILAIGWAIRARVWREFIVAGAMAGLAVGSKLSVAPLLFLAVPVAIVVGRSWRFRLAGCAGYILAAMVVVSPWLIRNWKWTGNPVFPEAMSILGQGHFSDVQVERWREAYWPDKDHQSAGGRIEALWEQVVGDWRYGFALVPLGCVAMGLTFKKRPAICLGALLIFQTVFWLFFTHLQGRFMVIVIPIIALLIAQYEGRGWISLCAVVAVAMACFSGAKLGWKMGPDLKLDRDLTASGPGLIGRENLDGMRIFDWRRLKSGESVDLVGDACAFLYQIPMTRLNYKTVFDVDTSDPKESIDDAWMAGMPRDGVVWRDAGEMRRFARTYYGIKPEIPSP